MTTLKAAQPEEKMRGSQDSGAEEAVYDQHMAQISRLEQQLADAVSAKIQAEAERDRAMLDAQKQSQAVVELGARLAEFSRNFDAAQQQTNRILVQLHSQQKQLTEMQMKLQSQATWSATGSETEPFVFGPVNAGLVYQANQMGLVKEDYGQRRE